MINKNKPKYKKCNTYMYLSDGGNCLYVMCGSKNANSHVNYDRFDFEIDFEKKNSIEIITTKLKEKYQFETAVVNDNKLRVALSKLGVEVYCVPAILNCDLKEIDYVTVRRGSNLMRGLGTAKPITSMKYLFEEYIKKDRLPLLEKVLESILSAINYMLNNKDLPYILQVRYSTYSSRLNKLLKEISYE